MRALELTIFRRGVGTNKERISIRAAVGMPPGSSNSETSKFC